MYGDSSVAKRRILFKVLVTLFLVDGYAFNAFLGENRNVVG